MLGAPITTDGTFYQDPAFGTDNPPSSNFIALVGDSLEFDSYIALDGGNANGQAGPSTPSYTANTPSSALPTEFTDNTLKINSAFALPGTGITSLTGGDGLPRIFFARLTVQGGSGSVSAPSVVVNLADGQGGIVQLDLTIGVNFENGVAGPDGNFYSIMVEQSQSAFGTVNDLYIVSYIPAPGVGGLLALCGVVGVRRRRAGR